jgi:hypothetical protein
MIRSPLSHRSATRPVMEPRQAREIAEGLHAADVDESGAPVLWHLRRVARRTPAEARAVAWLHEAFESTAVSEQELLERGLTTDELRALRLLHRATDQCSELTYLAHVDRIARAAGRSGILARMVKIADLEDRCLHPRVRPDGWSPPYRLGLGLLLEVSDDWRGAVSAD